MARPSKELPVRSSIVPAIVRHAAAAGLDVEALAWRFGLAPDAARRDEVTAGVEVAEELMHAVARASAEGDVPLRVVTQLTGRQQTLVGLAVRASSDVRDALGRLARWAPLLHEGLEASLEEGADEGRWVLRTPRRPRGVGRYVHEVALAHAMHHVRDGAPETVVARAWFAHARPAAIAPLSGFLGTTDLTFGHEDSGFALRRAALDRPMAHADRRTLDAIAPLIEAEIGVRPRPTSLADRLASHLAGSLPGGTDVADAARAMHMSPRTLQRRLEQEQTRFSEVLDRARLAEARRQLADPSITLTDVAFRLGFADLATFSRAFKRWTGVPPGQWRRS
jgi:AraC-like DNA-binding protein